MKTLFERLRAIVRAFRDELLDTPTTRAQEALVAAMRDYARRHAEAQYQLRLVEFFDNEAAKLDPEVDWNEFAAMKNKWRDHHQDLNVEARRETEAKVRVEACQERLTSLRENVAGL